MPIVSGPTGSWWNAGSRFIGIPSAWNDKGDKCRLAGGIIACLDCPFGKKGIL